MFCPNCGKPAKEGAAFCGICGFALKAPVAPVAPQPVAPAPAPVEPAPVEAQPAPVGVPVEAAPVETVAEPAVEVPATAEPEVPVEAPTEPAPVEEVPAPAPVEVAPVEEPVEAAPATAPAEPVPEVPVAPVRPVEPVAATQYAPQGTYQPAAAPMAPAPKKGFDFNQVTAQATEVFKNTIMPFVMKWKIPLIAGAAALVLIIGFFGIGSSQSNPENIVENYIEGLIDGDWEQVYDTLAVTENEFVNKEKFVAFQEKNGKDYSNITKYEIQSAEEIAKEYADEYNKYFGSFADKYEEEIEETLLKTYVVTYVTNTSSYPKTMTVTLAEQSEKTWLLFTKYRVSSEDLIGSHTIKTYKDAVVIVDGVQVAAPAEDEDGIAEFKIDAIFAGEHNLKITHPLCDAYEDVIATDSGRTTYATGLKISKAVKDELFKTSQENIKKLANGAKDGKALNSLGIAYTTDADDFDDLKKDYENLTNSFRKSDGTGLKSITYTGFTDNSYQENIGTSGGYSCSVGTQYTYTSTRKSYWDNSITENTSNTTGRFTLNYDYVDGKWVLKGFSYYNYYY